ncbi:MAG: hypothetical protein U5J99_10805 [Parvularculaceae bacterium]|nr:hypothetical protein [Parvularculaceae bacterium]
MSAPDPQLPPDARKNRGRRNLAIALGLAAFILTVYAVTILRIGGNILERP